MPDRHIVFLLTVSPNDCFLCDDKAINNLGLLSGMTGASLHFSLFCIIRLKGTVIAAVRSTHKTKRNPAPAACASELLCGQKGRLGNDLFPLLLPVSPSVSGQNCLCQISQLPREVINQTLHTSNRQQARKKRGFSRANLFPTHLSISLFPIGEKKVAFFSLERTQALTPAATQLRNAACASGTCTAPQR